MSVPPIRPNIGSQTFPINLFTSAGAVLKSHSPEAGDFVIYVDHVSQGNLAVAEAPAGSGLYQASPTQDQTNGALLSIRCEDQTSPAAWASFWLHIWTTARGVDDLAFPNTSGRGLAVDTSGRVDLGAILGAALSGTAAWLAAAFSHFFNVETPALTAADDLATGADVPTTEQIADAVHDEVVESGGGANWTLRQIMRVLFALTGKADGGGTTTPKFYGADGTTARFSPTVDASGNRTGVSRNGS
jgi:hypothetical protein